MIAVGGDGLIGAVAGAVAGTEGVMGIVPAGRGNDFARSLGLPLDHAAAARMLAGARAASDRHRRGRRQAVRGHRQRGHRRRGQPARKRSAGAARIPPVYAIAGVLALVTWRHASFELDVDGTKSAFRGFAVGVGNAPFYGGGMRLFPDARIDDGQLDVACFGTDSRLRFLRQIPQRRIGGARHQPHGQLSARTGRPHRRRPPTGRVRRRRADRRASRHDHRPSGRPLRPGAGRAGYLARGRALALRPSTATRASRRGDYELSNTTYTTRGMAIGHGR